MILALGRDADNFMGFRVFEDMNIVVGFFAAVQESHSEQPVLVAWPPVSFGSVAMPGGQEKISVLLDGVFFLVWVEVVYFHALPPSGAIRVLHRVRATLRKVLVEIIPDLAVIRSRYDLRRKMFANYAGSRGIRHRLSTLLRGCG